MTDRTKLAESVKRMRAWMEHDEVEDFRWGDFEAVIVAAESALLDETEPTARHDHSNDAKVWCVTHQHTHIASIPRFTYQCKACGWGQWYTPDARAHEKSCPGHETYEVEHVTVPMPAEPTPDEREALANLLDEQFGNWQWDSLAHGMSAGRYVAPMVLAAGFHRQGPITDDTQWEWNWSMDADRIRTEYPSESVGAPTREVAQQSMDMYGGHRAVLIRRPLVQWQVAPEATS